MELTKNDYTVEIIKPKKTTEEKVVGATCSILKIAIISVSNYFYQIKIHPNVMQAVTNNIYNLTHKQIPIYQEIGIPYWFCLLLVIELVVLLISGLKKEINVEQMNEKKNLNYLSYKEVI